jgi:hypothetical protein
MKDLEEASRKVRAAVPSARFPDVPAMTAEYLRQALERAHTLAPGDPEIERRRQEAEQLLEWARRTLLARRARLAAQLEAIQPLIAYLRNEQGGRNTWQTEG